MGETLHIKNFGPIKDVKLDLRKFNVIIGENATGKSTIAKVYAACKYFSFIMESTPLESYFEQGLEAWGLSEFIKNDTYIKYNCAHYSFTATRTLEKDIDLQTGEVDGLFRFFSTELIPISNEFKYLLNELNSIKKNQKSGYGLNQNWNIPTSFFQNDVASVLVNPLYIPTERGLQSVFSLGKSSIQNISDSLFNQFAKLDLVARNFKDEIIIEPFDLIYKNIDGRGYIRKENDERFYSLFNGASGYQSTIPVVLVLKYYERISKKIKIFLIEEPELNLFPKAQKELVNYFVANAIMLGNMFLLTTHSPYILTSLNNLMYAFHLGVNTASIDAKEVDKIIPKEYWLNSDEVSVYMLNSFGEAEDILDRKENLIHAEKIDGVSTIINKEFDKLINLEIGIADEKN